MRPEVLLPLALLFIAHGVAAQIGEGETTTAAAATTAVVPPVDRAAAPATGAPVVYYDVGRPFTLNCTAPRPNPDSAYVWTANGTALEQVQSLKNRYALEQDGATLRLTGRSQEDDFGTYSCAAGAAAQSWQLRGRPHAKLPPNTNVVEGQKLKLVCKVIGKPYPAVSWTYANSSEAPGVDVAQALGARATLQAGEQGVAGAVLVLEAAQRGDAGEFACAPAGGAAAATTLRVKDMYAALWPFLGICAEVFVLCAIILVYEKRRTKPELDDSDTDNHDQKKS